MREKTQDKRTYYKMENDIKELINDIRTMIQTNKDFCEWEFDLFPLTRFEKEFERYIKDKERFERYIKVKKKIEK
jgi:hypothetical protein